MSDLEKISELLNKVTRLQLVATVALTFLFYILVGKDFSNGILLSGALSISFSRMLHFSSKNKQFILFGSMLRIILLIVPFAILVHKFQINLIAFTLGFVICHIIFIAHAFQYASMKSKNEAIKEKAN